MLRRVNLIKLRRVVERQEICPQTGEGKKLDVECIIMVILWRNHIISARDDSAYC